MDGVRCNSRPGSLDCRVGRERLPIEELIRRRENGLDLWTGEPLEGMDADDWLQNEYQLGEEPRILSDEDLSALREVINIMSWCV